MQNTDMKKAMIFAAGTGSRLRPLVFAHGNGQRVDRVDCAGREFHGVCAYECVADRLRCVRIIDKVERILRIDRHAHDVVVRKLQLTCRDFPERLFGRFPGDRGVGGDRDLISCLVALRGDLHAADILCEGGQCAERQQYDRQPHANHFFHPTSSPFSEFRIFMAYIVNLFR